MIRRLPIIGVMGSGKDCREELARPLGRWLAQKGFHLLTGGGGGVMEAVARAFTEVEPREGLSIGIIPGQGGKEKGHPPAGYPNPYIELPVYTHLPDSGRKGTHPLSRNHINILSSDLLVFLPGGA
ncbi:MAG TPA: molybdenum cofactor carrier protein, partial [Caldithrix abyssi]|nr:molybdenum cofactor carrier protein [Caldithrix abyssi]